MAVKEIPRETQENVDIKVMEEAFFDSMSGFYGKRDLSWIDCLFNHDLKPKLGIEKGMIHCHEYGSNKVGKSLEQSWVYGEYGKPQALFYTKKLPKGFNLFMTGPEYNDKNLRIICSSPKINIGDFEEQVVIEEINSKVEKLIKGKHENVEGEIRLRELLNHPLEGVTLYKTWKMPVEPSFSFGKDIEDIQTFAQIYDGFFDYQRKRDESFKNTSSEIVKEVLDKQEIW